MFETIKITEKKFDMVSINMHPRKHSVRSFAIF